MAYRIKYLIGSLIFGLIFKVNVESFDREYTYMTDSLYNGFNFEALGSIFSFLFTILFLGISLFYFFVLGYQVLFPDQQDNSNVYFSHDTNDEYLKLLIEEKRADTKNLYVYMLIDTFFTLIFLFIPLTIVLSLTSTFPVLSVWFIYPLIFIGLLYAELQVFEKLFSESELIHIFKFQEIGNSLKSNKRYIKAAKKALTDMEKGTFSHVKYY